MTGHVCPECGVHRPGCACARAAEAAAEDFDPLRIRPYVTLDSPEGSEGQPTAHLPVYAAEPVQSTEPAHSTEDPPTTQLAAIRPGSDLTAPMPVAHPAGPETYPASPGAHPAGSETYPASPGARPAGPETYPADPGAHPEDGHPGATGDPSETMPLLLRGIGDVPPAHDQEHARGRGRRRGVVVAAVAAVAVVGTAALAAAVLGGADETGDRAAVPEVTTSASLNVAVSEAPSPSSSSETPEPTTSSPTPQRTSASPSSTPSPSRTTASPRPSTSPTTPPAAVPSAAPTTAAPTSATPSARPTEETAVTLSLGSTGEEVVELQARLTLAGAYHGDVDGEYDQEVWRAVKSYQSWMYIQGDPKGVYGPHTREALERSTWL
ncbi:peptidoglycan-binding protein [Streptomyces sp. TLI_105]|uniref:peptidoglycan-binding domain-containing protein n=1 Tax=Streptomyces sp. TLI_105 TaxID=1881019 RepID=UPI00089CA203|nr:peptidoglycan-binding domain-containing protein [Streptomyces sp. TLI_105]SED47559.1 Putative peptidoglycan binding domain-containing protein [Streptomyces sp. TLI_105]